MDPYIAKLLRSEHKTQDAPQALSVTKCVVGDRTLFRIRRVLTTEEHRVLLAAMEQLRLRQELQARIDIQTERETVSAS